MPKNIENAARLRHFGRKNFGTMTNFAKALEMKPQTLNNYLSGQVPIGATIRERLSKLGCDIEWLMTGKDAKPNQRGKIPTSEDDDMLMLAKLKSMGIDSLAKLESFLDPTDVFQDMVRLVRERQERYRAGSYKKPK